MLFCFRIFHDISNKVQTKGKPYVLATVKIELIKGKKLSDGIHQIILRLTHISKNKYIQLGASVKPVQWIGDPENWISKSYNTYKRLNV